MSAKPVVVFSPGEYVVKFYRGRVSLTLFDATGERCLCRDCLTAQQKDAMRSWLNSIPEPPMILLATAPHDPPKEGSNRGG